MPTTPETISEEDLDKQYADYRAQFEQWKEANKSSVGTEAYNSYVAQFEQWERDVKVRQEQNYQQKMSRKAAVQDKEAEAAAAYAQSQEAYMAHHLKAMEQQEMQQRAAAAAAAAAAQQQQMMQNMMMRQSGETVSNPPDMFMRDMFNGIPGARGGAGGQPPALWGNHKPIYDGRDPLFAKWGERAAPAHYKPDTETPINPVACWMLLDGLREKKMVLAPHSSTCPPPQIQGFVS